MSDDSTYNPASLAGDTTVAPEDTSQAPSSAVRQREDLQRWKDSVQHNKKHQYNPYGHDDSTTVGGETVAGARDFGYDHDDPDGVYSVSAMSAGELTEATKGSSILRGADLVGSGSTTRTTLGSASYAVESAKEVEYDASATFEDDEESYEKDEDIAPREAFKEPRNSGNRKRNIFLVGACLIVLAVAVAVPIAFMGGGDDDKDDVSSNNKGVPSPTGPPTTPAPGPVGTTKTDTVDNLNVRLEGMAPMNEDGKGVFESELARTVEEYWNSDVGRRRKLLDRDAVFDVAVEITVTGQDPPFDGVRRVRRRTADGTGVSVTYEQTTTYKTSEGIDVSLFVSDLATGPLSTEAGRAALVEGLKSADPTAFGSLTAVSDVSVVTPSPTLSPTLPEGHTASPTRTRTASPTGTPTVGPTGVPTTDSPTASPVIGQTPAPTRLQTTSPTDVPTKSPTGGPTTDPTGSPTSSPVVGATPSPTSVPTVKQTSGPTTEPTPAPTDAPTDPFLELLLIESPSSVDPILNDATSPQSFAYNWLKSDPNYDTYTDAQKLQKFALVTFHDATNGNVSPDPLDTSGVRLFWRNTNGWLGYDVNECDGWHGINCNEIGRVTDMEFHEPIVEDVGEGSNGNNLSGGVPVEILLLRDSLEVLNLHGNEIQMSTSELGAILGGLTNIKNLHIGDTWIYNNDDEPVIPTEFANLVSLEEFEMSYTQVQTHYDEVTSPNPIPIPDIFGNMPNLYYFEMEGNYLTGVTLPNSLVNRDSLALFFVRENNLGGDLSFLESGGMTSVVQWWMDANDLSGSIPTEIGLLNKLESLSLVENSLTGNLPPQFGNLTLLEELWLYSNELDGKVPSEIGSLPNLDTFHIENNDFTGEMPSEVCLRADQYESLVSDCATPEITCSLDCCTTCV